MSTLIVILFVLQLVSFYFIVLLNMKVSKYRDLERKQEQLMREMDEVVSAYLLEMREENDRLIQELSLKSNKIVNISKQTDQQETPQEFKAVENSTPQTSSEQTNKPSIAELESRMLVPKAMVAKAYTQQKKSVDIDEQITEVDDQKTQDNKELSLTYEEQVLKLYNQGKTVEQIAKEMKKGKTEIELLLKFHL